MSEHYFTRRPTSAIVEKEFQITFKGRLLKFISVSGVFSFGKPDKASLAFVKHMPELFGDVLDLGCGYGFIGLCVKTLFPDISMYMSDVNERAVRYAKINAKNNNLDVQIKSGDGFAPWKERKFNFILFNPPIAAGKRTWVRLVLESKHHLKKDGVLLCVGFHNKAGKTIEREMRTTFGNVSTLSKNGGIRVYSSRRES